MASKSETRWIPDLHYTVQPGGQFIDLEQHVGGGEMASIRLHKIHLRLLLQQVGLLTAPTPADELTRRLCEKLVETYLVLAEARELSDATESLFWQLSGFLDLIPTEYWPYHLWAGRDEKREPKQSAPAESGRPDFALEPPPQKGGRDVSPA